MPGADSSQFTALKRLSSQVVPPHKGKDPHYQAPISPSGVGLGLTGFLPSLTIKNTRPLTRFKIRVGVPTNQK